MSDCFWSQVEPLIPVRSRDTSRAFQRRPGAGRKPIPPRKVFEAILHVLRTGTPWKELPRDFGSGSAIHRRFEEWQDAGLFRRLWDLRLAEHEEMAGIAWEWIAPEGGRFATGGERTSGPPDPARPGPTDPGAAPIRPRAWEPARSRRPGRHSRRQINAYLISG